MLLSTELCDRTDGNEMNVLIFTEPLELGSIINGHLFNVNSSVYIILYIY